MEKGAPAVGSVEEGVPPEPNSLLAEISVLKPRALAKIAEDRGISEDKIEAADEGTVDGRKAALIALIMDDARAKAEARAAAAEATRLAQQLKDELMSMSAMKISRKAADMGIAEGEIEAADEADDRKAALIALVLQYDAAAHLSAEELQLKAELEAMSAFKISKRATAMGIDEDKIEAADEAEDRQGALIELIMASARKPEAPRAQVPVRVASSPARSL